jgi:hypothetical protein
MSVALLANSSMRLLRFAVNDHVAVRSRASTQNRIRVNHLTTQSLFVLGIEKRLLGKNLANELLLAWDLALVFHTNDSSLV